MTDAASASAAGSVVAGSSTVDSGMTGAASSVTGAAAAVHYQRGERKIGYFRHSIHSSVFTDFPFFLRTFPFIATAFATRLSMNADILEDVDFWEEDEK
jgi:hypothetical protein